MSKAFLTPFIKDIISAKKRVDLVLHSLKDQGYLPMTAKTFRVSISIVSLS